MEIIVSQQQGRVPVTIFRIQGDIDVSSYEELQARANTAYASGTRHLLLDMTDVPYISSAGLRALHAIFNLMRSKEPSESNATVSKGLRDGSYKSAHLKLLNPPAAVRQVLSMAGMDMFLEIHRDLKTAVASF